MTNTLIYYLFAVVLGLAAVSHSGGQLNRLGWGFAFVALLIFVGLRHHIGMDWNNYLAMTNWIANKDYLDALGRVEPGFATLTWLSTRLGTGVYGVNFIAAGIFLAGLFRLCRRTRNPWLALMTAYPYLIVVVANSASRQSIAIGILLWLVAEWHDTPLWKRTLLVLTASAFHYSALFFLLFVAIDVPAGSRWRATALVIGAALCIWLLEITGRADYFLAAYLTDPYSMGAYSPGALQHVLLNAIPALVIFAGRDIRQLLVPSRIILLFSILALALIPVSFIASTAASRLSLYLFPVSILIVSALPELVRHNQKLFVRTGVALALIAQLAIWMTYANSRHAYIPYMNVITVSNQNLHL